MEFNKDTRFLKTRLLYLATPLRDLGHEVYNPLVEEPIIIQALFKTECSDMTELKTKYPDNFKSLIKKLRIMDCNLIQDCDIVLAFPTDVVSGGMAGEVTLAAYLGKHILFFYEDLNHEANLSSWVKSCATEVYYNTSTDTILTAISKV